MVGIGNVLSRYVCAVVTLRSAPSLYTYTRQVVTSPRQFLSVPQAIELANVCCQPKRLSTRLNDTILFYLTLWVTAKSNPFNHVFLLHKKNIHSLQSFFFLIFLKYRKKRQKNDFYPK